MFRNIFFKIFFTIFFFGIIFFAFPKTTSAMTYGEIQKNTSNCQKTISGSGYDTYACTTPDSGGTPGVTDVIVWSCDTSSEKGECTSKPVVSSSNSDSSVCVPLPGWGFSLSGCFLSIVNTVFYYFFYFINWVLGGILWLASYILDFTIYFTVVKFRSSFTFLDSFASVQNSGGLVYYLWGMIRDFLNIAIFIIIIYTAVQSMFEGFQDTRKKFITLLVFSIVTNFSLLFIKLSIDISNILTLQAYTLGITPKSFNTFADFRTASENSSSNKGSYGELISSVISMEELKNFGGTSEELKKQVEDQKSSAFFEIGRMVVNIGVIWLFLMIAGMFLMRALYFVLAMITSPLIVADFYFGLRKGTEADKLAASIREITKKFRDDYLDALIKGPLFAFTLYLICVLGKAILSFGLISELSNGVKNNAAANNALSPMFVNSIGVFFKFAIFFFMINILFKKINAIKFSQSAGGKNLMRLGGWMGGRFLQGTSGITGMIGRNTIGRGAGNLAQSFANLNIKATANLANSKTLTGRLGYRALQLATQGAVNKTSGLAKGSFDLADKVNNKDSRLGGLIRGAGIESGALGKGGAGGFQERINKETEAREKKIKEDTEKIKANYNPKLSEDAQKKIEDKKAEFSGVTMSLKQMSEAISRRSELEEKKGRGEGAEIGGKQFTNNQLTKILDTKDGKSLEETHKFERASAEASAMEDAKKKFAKDMERVASQGKLGKVTDFVSPEAFGAAKKVAENAEEKIYKDSKNKTQESAKKTSKKYSVISSTREDLGNLKKKLESVQNSQLGLSGEQKEAIKDEIDRINVVLSKDYIGKANPSRSAEDQTKFVKDFEGDKETQNTIYDIHNKSAAILEQHFDSFETSSAYSKAVAELRGRKKVIQNQIRNGAQPEFKSQRRPASAEELKAQREEIETQIKNLEELAKFTHDQSGKAEKFNERIEENFATKPADAAKPADTKAAETKH